MRAFLLTTLLLCGCQKNHAELTARLADTDRQLAHHKLLADNLLDDRKALVAAEWELAAALAQSPEARDIIASIPAEKVPPPVVPSFPPLPPASAFEGEKGARLRRQILKGEHRISQLAKITAEAEQLQARRKHLERQLALLRQR